MAKGDPRLSETERELQAAMDGTLAPEAAPARPMSTNDQVPNTDRGTCSVPVDQKSSPSQTVIESADSRAGETTTHIHSPGELGDKCVGTVVALRGYYGFLHVAEKERRIYFSEKHCFGHFKELRIADQVDCYVKLGHRGPWAYRIRRVRKND